MKIFVEGKEAFLKRLDTYFTHVQDGFDQNSYMGLFQISNEPAFLVPSLYNYVNRPDKAAEIVRRVLKERYNTTATGLPGNDDSGSMSAWDFILMRDRTYILFQVRYLRKRQLISTEEKCLKYWLLMQAIRISIFNRPN